MKRTVTETITKEVEVKLPYFTKVKSGRAYFAVLPDENVWVVNIYDFHSGVEITNLNHSNALNYEPCTKEEFLAAYEQAMKAVSNLPLEQPIFKD